MEPLESSDPALIGDYRLTSRLGEGGMGQVYLAQTASGRQVAVKVIRPGLVQDSGFRARFAREVDSARRVGGFHTAPVVDADLDAAPPWIATAYIPGPTLAQRVRGRGPITPPELHRLVVGLTEGLKAVHDCGLVHRDLKPGNVILSDDGPRIIDFGIARPLDAESLTTREAVFGTLPYMSPEQTDGSRVGAESDVFSLGTVLAYSATGTNPFNGATMAETVRRLIGSRPDPGAIDPDTRALIIDCWNPDPARRPTPDAIAVRFGALVALVAESPPSGTAGSDPAGHPDATTVAGSAAGGGTRAQHTAVEVSQDTGEKPRMKAPTRLIGAGAGLAALTAVAAAGIVALSDGGGAQPASGPDTTDGPEVDASSGPEPETVLAGGEGSARKLAFSPDGSTLVTQETLSETARLWDTETGEEITALQHPEWVNAVGFSPDGAILATASFPPPSEAVGDPAAGTVRLWDTDSWQVGDTFETEGLVESVAFSPDGGTLVTTSDEPDYAAKLWDTATWEETGGLSANDAYGPSYSVAFSPDGTTLATAGDGRGGYAVRLWDTGTRDKTHTLDHSGKVKRVAFSPDGATIVAPDGKSARLWNAGTGEQITSLHHDYEVISAAFSPDGALLATSTANGAGNGTVRLWDTENWKETAPLSDHAAGVGSVAFSPDGALLATAEDDGSIALWPVDTGSD